MVAAGPCVAASSRNPLLVLPATLHDLGEAGLVCMPACLPASLNQPSVFFFLGRQLTWPTKRFFWGPKKTCFHGMHSFALAPLIMRTIFSQPGQPRPWRWDLVPANSAFWGLRPKKRASLFRRPSGLPNRPDKSGKKCFSVCLFLWRNFSLRGKREQKESKNSRGKVTATVF